MDSNAKLEEAYNYLFELQNQTENQSENPLISLPQQQTHFRGHSFGVIQEESAQNIQQGYLQRLLQCYECSLNQQKDLESQIQKAVQMHQVQKQMWVQLSQNTDLELKRLQQRNSDLAQIINNCQKDIQLYQNDIEMVIQQAEEAEKQQQFYQNLVAKLEAQLEHKEKLLNGNDFQKIVERKPVGENGKLMSKLKGRQEINMPFLSGAVHNWKSSLRNQLKGYLRKIFMEKTIKLNQNEKFIDQSDIEWYNQQFKIKKKKLFKTRILQYKNNKFQKDNQFFINKQSLYKKYQNFLIQNQKKLNI